MALRLACAVLSVASMGVVVAGCNDTSDYDSDDYSTTTPGHGGTGGGGTGGYHYDDTPDGRFNPSPPSGPYAP